MHLVILMLAAVTACDRAESAGKKPGGPGGPGGGPPAMPVEAAAARSDTVVDAILATGQIEALQSIELRPDVEGRLTQILVREGALVSRGTPLFKIDDAELKAQVDQITAERDLARQSLNRTRELLSQKASSQSELERARAAARFSFVNGLQTTGGFGGRADLLAEGWTFFRDPNYVNTVLSQIDRVRLSDLDALARERLIPANRVILVYVPAKKTASQTSSTRMP